MSWVQACYLCLRAAQTQYWRRARDSNPRWAQTHNGFQDRRIKPLCQPSGTPDFKRFAPTGAARILAPWTRSAFAHEPTHRRTAATPPTSDARCDNSMKLPSGSRTNDMCTSSPIQRGGAPSSPPLASTPACSTAQSRICTVR